MLNFVRLLMQLYDTDKNEEVSTKFILMNIKTYWLRVIQNIL